MKIKLHLEGNKNMTHNQEKENFKILLLVLFQREHTKREKVSKYLVSEFLHYPDEVNDAWHVIVAATAEEQPA